MYNLTYAQISLTIWISLGETRFWNISGPSRYYGARNVSPLFFVFTRQLAGIGYILSVQKFCRNNVKMQNTVETWANVCQVRIVLTSSIEFLEQLTVTSR